MSQVNDRACPVASRQGVMKEIATMIVHDRVKEDVIKAIRNERQRRMRELAVDQEEMAAAGRIDERGRCQVQGKSAAGVDRVSKPR